MQFRQATIEDIPQLVECRIRQLTDEGQTPDKDITAANEAYFRERFERRARERNVCRIWLEGSKWGLPVYKKYGFKENDTILTIETEDQLK